MNVIANPKRKKLLPTWHTWCLCSDGELDEGQTWEAILFAGKRKLRELTVFLDRNNIQIDGNTEQIMPLEPLAKKLRAFNWHVIEIDGNNIREVIAAAKRARQMATAPTMIVCHTIPGKGVPYMENNFEWHGKTPTHAEALNAIQSLGGRITKD